MGAENKTNTGNDNKKRKQRYLSNAKPFKKGSYPLYPGVQGFFITCDGGRERQAAREAINVIDTFLEELVDGGDSGTKCKSEPSKPLNKITKFSDSDFSSDDEKESDPQKEEQTEHENTDDVKETPLKKPCLDTKISKCENVVSGKREKPIDELIEAELKDLKDRSKRRFVSLDSGCNGVVFVKMLKKDGDPGPTEIVNHMMTSASSTRKHMSRFILRILPIEVSCYASEEEISKAIKPIVEQYFPVEALTALKNLIRSHSNTPEDKIVPCFPDMVYEDLRILVVVSVLRSLFNQWISPIKLVTTLQPTLEKRSSPNGVGQKTVYEKVFFTFIGTLQIEHKEFAVLYDARANTGIDRMAIINSVAKSIPEPHKVDLTNPDKSIVVQIVKTVCLVGVVEKYKEFSKYNLRQLTSPKP
ncbi:hypothetical protein GIB67_019791 [Kingdonia uniflora]|uniref:THUMP domain-containing protein n=1 Tax=Kingdonia uniflora TaxID=39325 RepID=A0A7J7MK24_9MAGN|nr:hypothetical protein GIB67_019791 [Kingdonia uniflora]